MMLYMNLELTDWVLVSFISFFFFFSFFYNKQQYLFIYNYLINNEKKKNVNNAMRIDSAITQCTPN